MQYQSLCEIISTMTRAIIAVFGRALRRSPLATHPLPAALTAAATSLQLPNKRDRGCRAVLESGREAVVTRLSEGHQDPCVRAGNESSVMLQYGRSV